MEQERPPSHGSISQWLASLGETDSPVLAIHLHATVPWPKDRRSAPGVFTSLLLHFSVLFLLVRLPLAKFLAQPPAEERRGHVVYMLHPLNLADYFPALKPPGPGGRPGQGSRPDRPPARGSTAFHPRLTIVSNPPHPDNSRQTIIQTASPPQLKIPYEIKLPNILISAAATPPPPQRPPPPAPPAPKPLQIHVPVVPRPPAPLPAAPALSLVAPPNPLPNPALPVPMPAPPEPPSAPEPPVAPTQAAAASEGKPLDELDTRKNPAGAGLFSLSVEPAPSAESVALPPGNRQGAFTISPAGGKEGSPGGVPGGDALGGGAGGKGPAGDASTGLGSGDRGGGGGDKGAPGSTSSNDAGPGGVGGAGGAGAGPSPLPTPNVSIAGNPGNDKDGVLPSFYGATSVYPVSPPGPRRPMMVVTSGPTGGGGLQVYGVLKGKKIYTIYLPMPDRNWILQYCALDSAAPPQEPVRPSVEIKLEIPIAPPSAMEQFDFHRPPVSATDASRSVMIILQGTILEDGSVGDLKVYKGFGPVDQAAVAAFRRWKFRPAQRSNKPIAVEILVGIPLIIPTT